MAVHLLLHVKLRYQSKLHKLWNFHATIFCILEFIFPFIVCKILVSDDARETGGGERFGEGQPLSDTPPRSRTMRASVARYRTQ